MALLAAGDVSLPYDLKQTMGKIGTQGQSAISSNYGRLKGRQQTESGVRGLSAKSNSYGPERMAAQQGLDMGALESSLGGALGETAYKDVLGGREYDQNMQLANEIGDLNKPDLLQQIFGGIGAVGKPVSTYYGMKGMKGPKPAKPTDSLADYDGDF